MYNKQTMYNYGWDRLVVTHFFTFATLVWVSVLYQYFGDHWAR